MRDAPPTTLAIILPDGEFRSLRRLKAAFRSIVHELSEEQPARRGAKTELALATDCYPLNCSTLPTALEERELRQRFGP